MEIDQKTWDINLKEVLNINGRGAQHIYVELIASPYVYDNDIVRVYMDLDLPEDLLKKETIVYQYAQLLPTVATEGTDYYTSFGCQITVKEDGEEAPYEVDNFFGVGKLDATATSG